jgi:hypothetical protein
MNNQEALKIVLELAKAHFPDQHGDMDAEAIRLVTELTTGPLTHEGGNNYSLEEGEIAWVQINEIALWIHGIDSESFSISAYPVGEEADDDALLTHTRIEL